MDNATATQLVANDQRRSYPGMTDAEAVAHVRNTVSLEMLDDDRLSEAYRVVLAQDA